MSRDPIVQYFERCRTIEVSDHRGVGPSRCRTIEVSDHRGVGPSRCRTIEVSDHRGVGPSGCRTIEVSDHRGVGPSRCRTIEVSDHRGVGPSRCRTIEVSDHRGVGPSRCRTIERTPIGSVFLYNSELWTLTQALCNKIDSIQRKFLRRVLQPVASWPRGARQPRSQTVSVGGGKIIFLLFL